MKVYLCKTDGFCERDGLDLIVSYRKEKINKAVNKHDKLRLIVSSLLLRYAFGDRANEIVVDRNGKPLLIDGPCFSISHSGNCVILAVSNSLVGADIQLHRKVDFTVADRFLHSDEKSLLCCNDGEKQEKTFYRLWTGKESISKAIGIGLNKTAKSYSLAPCNDGIYKIGETLYLLRWFEDENYTLCIAQHGVEPIEFIQTYAEDLVK